MYSIDTTYWFLASGGGGSPNPHFVARLWRANFFSARLRRAGKNLRQHWAYGPVQLSYRVTPYRPNIQICEIESLGTTNHILRCERPKVCKYRGLRLLCVAVDVITKSLSGSITSSRGGGLGECVQSSMGRGSSDGIALTGR